MNEVCCQRSLQKLSHGLWPVKGTSEAKDISHSSVLNPRLNVTCTAWNNTVKSVMASPPIPSVILSSTGILLNSWWSLCISLMSDFMLVIWCLALCPNTQQRANVSIWRSLLWALGGISWENCPASQFPSFLLQNQCRNNPRYSTLNNQAVWHIPLVLSSHSFLVYIVHFDADHYWWIVMHWLCSYARKVLKNLWTFW